MVGEPQHELPRAARLCTGRVVGRDGEVPHGVARQETARVQVQHERQDGVVARALRQRHRLALRRIRGAEPPDAAALDHHAAESVVVTRIDHQRHAAD